MLWFCFLGKDLLQKSSTAPRRESEFSKNERLAWTARVFLKHKSEATPLLHVLIHLRRLGHLRLLLLTHLHSRLHRLEHLLLLHERLLLHRILPTILHHRHLHSCWLCFRRLTSFRALLLFFLFLFFWCWRWSRRGFGSIWFTSSSCSLDLGVALLSLQSCLKRCLSAGSTS